MGSPLPNKNDWDIVSWGNRTPQQPNSYDCGVFVCIYAEAIARNSHPSNINNIYQNPRNWLYHSITGSSLQPQQIRERLSDDK